MSSFLYSHVYYLQTCNIFYDFTKIKTFNFTLFNLLFCCLPLLLLVLLGYLDGRPSGCWKYPTTQGRATSETN